MLKKFVWQFLNVYTESWSCPMFPPLPFPTWTLFPTKPFQPNIYFFDPLSLIMVALMSVLGTGTWAIRTEQGRKLRYTHASGAKWAQHKAMLLPPGQSYPLACLVAWGSSWTSDALVLTVSFLRFLDSWQGAWLLCGKEARLGTTARHHWVGGMGLVRTQSPS